MLNLPIPPSTNSLFPGKAKRFKSDEYKAWIQAAGWELNRQKPHVVKDGLFSVEIQLPFNMRGDIDNRIKAVVDLLGKHGVTPDDAKMGSVLAIRMPDVPEGRCIVHVCKFAAPKAAKARAA